MVLHVNTSEAGYDIILERGSLERVSEYFNLNRKVLIITDSGVPMEYALTVQRQCKEAYIHVLDAGEQSKSIDNYIKALQVLVDMGMTRTDCVVAVGGGVVGDFSGFVASTYMRGIDFYNIPTTFLSQVDSSIGGKVAIDFMGVKNIVGAFYQPKGVLIDSNTLKTLDKRQLHAGLCESIKMSATSNKELFELIENSTSIDNDLDEIIEKSLIIKRDVVEKDPKEKGLRRVLNFGHTIGHGIESKYGLKGYLHGECVGMGMLPMCESSVKQRIKALLNKYQIPTDIDLANEDIMDYIKKDKKASGNQITIVYVEKIGTFELKKIEIEEIQKYIKRGL
ncbi:MAG: 3-dehydroquinate synthase [Clostridia bacterium]|nr:3-dehydroquinate synthase [Clostridia bacterium]